MNNYEEKYFLFHVSTKPVWKKHEIKSFSIVQSIKFCTFDVKAIVTKKSRVTFCEKSQKKRNMTMEILS